MYEGFSLLSFLYGLPLGLLIAGVIGLFTIRRGMKERRYDERYNKIHGGARSFAWFATYFVLIVMWAIVLIYEPPGLAFFIITIVFIVHVISYWVSAVILSKKN